MSLNPKNPDDMLRLMVAAEEIGCMLLPDLCNGQKVRYAIPGSKGGVKVHQTTACGKRARYAVPYDRLDKQGKVVDEMSVATICAHDDMIHLWPRFEKAAEDLGEDF